MQVCIGSVSQGPRLAGSPVLGSDSVFHHSSRYAILADLGGALLLLNASLQNLANSASRAEVWSSPYRFDGPSWLGRAKFGPTGSVVAATSYFYVRKTLGMSSRSAAKSGCGPIGLSGSAIGWRGAVHGAAGPLPGRSVKPGLERHGLGR